MEPHGGRNPGLDAASFPDFAALHPVYAVFVS